ncbi:MAG: beta-propeller fold lactonase family protein [bacterium]
MINQQKKSPLWQSMLLVPLISSSVLVGCGGDSDGNNNDNNQAQVADTPIRSTSIALTSKDRRLVLANREKNTVSILAVRNDQGEDTQALLAEVAVGKEPRFVAITPDDQRALVSNTVDGTISVIDLSTTHPTVISTIDVDVEPRGIVISPNGQYAFVAQHTAGSVTVIDMSTLQVINRVATGGNPQALAMTNDGDHDDHDETVFVTRFFSEIIDIENRPDGFDDSKQGIVDQFAVNDALSGHVAVQQVTLPPIASGFSADRRAFCAKTRQALQDNGETVFFNSGADRQGNGAAALKSEVFCPDSNSTDISADGSIAKTEQHVYPNSLNAALIRGNSLYVLNVGAQPEPPVKFNVNVQPLIHVVDVSTGRDTGTGVNLNAQIKTETQPDEADLAGNLQRLFGNDVVAMDANKTGNDFLIVSRGSNVVMRANLDSNNRLTINAPDNVIRFKTGNMPNGIVMSSDGKRAYTNNEISTSVTAIDLSNNQVLAQDINASTPPEIGSQEHRNTVGKLAFFTALGIPDVLDTNADGIFDIAIRDIDPTQFRNKASDNGWSSCASCHEDGHSDNVTWIFPTGPRQTVPLEGSFARNNLDDQRIFNWNGVRGSVTDFNNNSRGVQGGQGHATNVNGVNRTGEVFNHGPTKGISDALDAMTEWVATIRSPIMPDASVAAGTALFTDHCASCHGGAKWTISRTSPNYINNPTFIENPLGANFFNGVAPIDPTVIAAGPQIRQAGAITFIENVGTRDNNNVLEIRGAGAIAGQSTAGFNSLGGIGFNIPSLLGVAYHAPYLHDGSAETLQDVFKVHQLPAQDNVVISDIFNANELHELENFLLSIDDDTPIIQ